MAHVIGYHRPSSLDEALSLLSSSDPLRVILGGGTSVNARPSAEPVEVVDLQALDINDIEAGDGRVVAGATATLESFATSDHVPGTLAELARREAPSTIRAVATLGGLIAEADPESELLAGLLVHETVVTIREAGGTRDRDLGEVLADGPGPGIITALTFEPGGTTAVARTGRTPADRPIVAAVARSTASGDLRIAVCGVAATPVLVSDVAGLEPPGDFRGSGGYRKRLAEVLVDRVRREVG